jgi:hypothetical protein
MKLFVGAGLAALLAFSAAATAQVYHRGYVRQDGTYVQPHYQSAPDGNKFNNYSTQGNINPYTGQAGTVNPYTQPTPYGSSYSNPYGSGRYGSSYGR